MARKLTAPLILVAVACLAAVGSGRGQTLQRLTVQSFVLSADTMQPQVDVPFHVIVTLHVRERVGEITSLQLPMLAQFELLGDEALPPTVGVSASAPCPSSTSLLGISPPSSPIVPGLSS